MGWPASLLLAAFLLFAAYGQDVPTDSNGVPVTSGVVWADDDQVVTEKSATAASGIVGDVTTGDSGAKADAEYATTAAASSVAENVAANEDEAPLESPDEEDADDTEGYDPDPDVDAGKETVADNGVAQPPPVGSRSVKGSTKKKNVGNEVKSNTARTSDGDSNKVLPDKTSKDDKSSSTTVRAESTLMTSAPTEAWSSATTLDSAGSSIASTKSSADAIAEDHGDVLGASEEDVSTATVGSEALPEDTAEPAPDTASDQDIGGSSTTTEGAPTTTSSEPSTDSPDEVHVNDTPTTNAKDGAISSESTAMGEEGTTQEPQQMTTIKDYQAEFSEIVTAVTQRVLPLATRFLGDSKLSPSCGSQLFRLFNGLRKRDAWALRMLTANGLLPSNLYEGGLSNLGSYEQCLRTMLPASGGQKDIKGQYCTLLFRPPKLFYNRTARQFNSIGEMLGRRGYHNWEQDPRGYATSDIRVGICTPSGCTEDDFNHIATSFLSEYGAKAVVRSCRVDSPTEIGEMHIGIFCVLGSSLGLVILATMVELCVSCCRSHREDPKHEGMPVRVVKCFSLIHNTRALFVTSKSIGCPKAPVRFVYGVKVIMAFWVILGNSYYTSNYQTLHSGYRILDLYSQVHAQLVANAFYAVSTFFFLSGFVLAYFVCVNKEESSNKSFLGLYVTAVVRRYLRLTIPAMAVVMCFFLFPLFISGPQDQDLLGQEQDGCYKNWWTVFAQIVNFIPTEDRCMQQYWYISSDMQVFLAAVPLSLIFVRSPACGFSLAILLSIICSAAAGIVTYMRNLRPTVIFTMSDFSRNLETAELVHELPYSNLATYFMGVMSGFCAAAYRDASIHKVLQGLLWIVALSLNLFLVFVPYMWNRSDTEELGLLYAAFYGGCYRYAWGLSWAWMAYACAAGRGGFVGRFLSWGAFVALGRLALGVYLVQYLVFLAKMGMTRNPIEVNEFMQVKDTLGVTVISYFFAYILYIVYEAPAVGVAKMMFNFGTCHCQIRKPKTSTAVEQPQQAEREETPMNGSANKEPPSTLQEEP